MLPTDHFLWGTTVPAGEHIVELQNEPLSLRLSFPISRAAAIVVLGAFTCARFARVGPSRRPGHALLSK